MCPTKDRRLAHLFISVPVCGAQLQRFIFWLFIQLMMLLNVTQLTLGAARVDLENEQIKVPPF